MLRILKRDIYGLNAPGFPIDEVSVPDPDPLASARCSCVHWDDHLYYSNSISGEELGRGDDLQDSGPVRIFLEKKYVYWLEALN